MVTCIFFENSYCWKSTAQLASATTVTTSLWYSGNCISCIGAMQVGSYNWMKVPQMHNVNAGRLLSGATVQVSGFV